MTCATLPTSASFLASAREGFLWLDVRTCRYQQPWMCVCAINCPAGGEGREWRWFAIGKLLDRGFSAMCALRLGPLAELLAACLRRLSASLDLYPIHLLHIPTHERETRGSLRY